MTQTKKLIEYLQKNKIMPLENAIRVGILPNDGKIILGFPDAILSYDESNLYIATFDGLMVQTFDQLYKLEIREIKDIEMGKYNLKDRYLKLTFKNDLYVAFNYHLKDKKYEMQSENVAKFIQFLENLAH